VPLFVFKAIEIEKKLKKLGFECVRQKGSHKQFRHTIDNRATTVPFHKGKDVSPILFKKIASDIKISAEELANQ